MIPRVKKNDGLSAEKQNRLIDAANAALSPAIHGGTYHSGESGTASVPGRTMIVDLFEIVDDWTYPGSAADDPTPYTANAKRCILTWDTAGGDAYNIYKHTVSSTVVFTQQTIYAPTCYRDDSEIGFGPRPAGPGQRVWCKYNNQGERWELLSPAIVLWAFAVLDEDLDAGSTATASLWIWNGTALADSGDNVTAHDWLLGAGETIASGTKVKVEYMPDAERWYVTAAECS